MAQLTPKRTQDVFAGTREDSTPSPAPGRNGYVLRLTQLSAVQTTTDLRADLLEVAQMERRLMPFLASFSK